MGNNALFSVLFFISVLLLPVDGFPLGSQFLREFGARPTNFFLLAAAFFLFNRIKYFKLSTRNIFLYVLVAMWCINNFMMTLFGNTSLTQFRSPFNSWVLQGLMLVWMFASYKVWQLLLFKLADTKPGFIHKTFVNSGIFALICFASHSLYISFGSYLIPGFEWLLEFLNGPMSQFRISGITTEPSIWGSWVAFVWPILLLGSTSYSGISKVVGLLLIIAAFLSGARTFLVILVIQLAVLLAWQISSRAITVKKLFFILFFTVFIGVLFIVNGGYQRLFSTADINENLSNIARIGSNITALKVIRDNPVFGIGIGQFTNAYGKYVPTFTLVSDEVVSWADGTSNTRASTFNLFLRIYVELGLPFFLASLYFVVSPFYDSVRLLRRENTSQHRYSICYLIAYIGGTTFWLSQDQYGYQVGILSYALLDMYNRLFKS